MEFLNPGSWARQRVPAALRGAHRDDTGTPRPPSGCGGSPRRSSCAGSRPTGRSSPTCPSKIEMTVYCRLTREQATLYQAVVDDMLERIDDERGHRAAGPGAGHDAAPQAGLQPPGPPPGRRLGRCRAARASSRALDELLEEVLAEGDRALAVHPVRRVRGDAPDAPAGAVRREVLFLHGGDLATPTATRWSRASEADGWAPALRPLAQGRRHGPQPDRGQPRVPLRPLVEPGGREPGHRPRLSDRPDASRSRSTSSSASGTLEERIAALIESKRELAAMVVGTGETWLTELSTAELRDLADALRGRGWTTDGRLGTGSRGRLPADEHAAAGEGRPQGEEPPRRHRRDVVVAALHRGPGATSARGRGSRAVGRTRAAAR